MLPLLVILLLAAWACAPSPYRQAPPAPEQEAATSQNDMEEKFQEKLKYQAEVFEALKRKMDEYQDLQMVCDSISENTDKNSLKAACTDVLKMRRRELLDLSEHLEEQ